MSDKYIDFTVYDLDKYLKLMKQLFEAGRYDDAKETARSFMYYCEEKKGETVRG